MSSADFGKWMRVRRTATLEEVAREVGKSGAWLSNVERGVFPAKPDDVVRLAVAVGASPTEALDVWGYMPPWARTLDDKLTQIVLALKLSPAD